ncbi:molecular chaperone DnaJ [Helicobacter cholecystus]|uniref:Molecular chaperone DnaJ n=1 Tax=Helicobacter cholecystus TaxID=45498 RepID=A0A3D8IXC5_9HELI|nr:TerB family tellurite resistance protein [Helicobacter cholecystus]RDU69616.1 molecular chaperone DnaJ [Helicobacter cholecystus]VEJ24175.1 DnaJ domain-containing protein [Helicobacter cholecystus]
MDILTLLVIIVAGVVMYFLWNTLKEYLSIEENVKRFKDREFLKDQIVIEEEPSFEEKILASEYGVLAGILGYVGNADGEICDLEKQMAFSLLDDMANEMNGLGDKEEVLNALKEIFLSSNNDIQALCEKFLDLSKGEYKKKLKVVEFCFALGYADGNLNDTTKDAILDVGAFLQIDNSDFNKIYDDFEKNYYVEVSQQEAKEIFGEYTNLQMRYEELIAKSKQNILEDKTHNKPITKESLVQLQKIQKAYEILKS